MSDDHSKMALEYHRLPTPGKISVTPTKNLANQRDLSLAYSPGVAAACLRIAEDPSEAASLTVRANLVAVITNGTAVLGLGNIGPLAAKPVMEGKGVLFKKFAGVDVFDIELDELNADKIVDIVASLEPTFGGINLEDIRAPECFVIERKLRERMKIPVFHDDQHGTAIVVAAAIYNGLRVVEKRVGDVRLVCSGAGAAALATLNLLVSLGLDPQKVLVCDRSGVIYKGRDKDMDEYKIRWARRTNARTLTDALVGADIFLGVSGPRVMTGEMAKGMAARPIILALANPTPEILPEEARAARPDAIIATGRSDYPNQVNNVLCFPFIFRGALDVGATTINEEMKVACVRALADLAMAEPSDVVASAYRKQSLTFGPEYLIPKPFDPRILVEVAPAVAKAAMASGVATRPITDFDAYRERLNQFVYRSGIVMKPLFDDARKDPKRLVYADGEENQVLRALQIVVDDGLAKPILIGRRRVIERRIKKLALRLKLDQDFALCDPEDDPRYRDYWQLYHSLTERRGVTPDEARAIVRTNTTVIGALMLARGEADALLCGVVGRFEQHLEQLVHVVGLRPGVKEPAGVELLMMPRGTVFMADTAVSYEPSAEHIAETAIQAAGLVRRFGLAPKVALVSHSTFGSADTATARRLREALALIRREAPDLEVEGEMRADAALVEAVRNHLFPNAQLRGQANVLVMPNLDAANIAFNLAKCLAEGLSIGPILVGMAKPAHIVPPSVTVRGLVNM
ncbi:MAG: NADP-dependent malic enzyme, partial [Alphaproteobacteria bacterium]|nr:NADP-dependent malic enzyme [Alphaproteobacteria bacterium]